ncbi:MAG: NADH-quinone oxidoreductase subunit H, partial [Rhodobacter sp.]|nr:NADH-quinone oxidoreductase subunit H [Rhodobacter sp.]
MAEFFFETNFGIFLYILGQCLLVTVCILVALAFLMYA